jgi:uncharacterized membrane protein
MKAKNYRALAWQAVKSTLVPSVLAALAAFYLGGLLTNAAANLTITIDGEQRTIPSLLNWLPGLLGVGGIWAIIQMILGGPIRQGYCIFLLKQKDGEVSDVADVFSQLHNFGAGFCLRLLQGLYIVLWGLLLIVPGIIASYRYAMAPFIMAENPEMTASEAITASKELMDGHKWELFCLRFSFIGWELLSILSLGVGALVLNPYMNAAEAAFYRSLCPRKIPQPVVECLPDNTAE